jgi:uncharacterized membrane protein YgcG
MRKFLLTFSYFFILLVQVLVFVPGIGVVSVSVQAQDSNIANQDQTVSQANGVLGFSDCSPGAYAEAGPGGGSSLVFNCVRSVLRFVFILGLFIGAFRFAVAALGNYAPGATVDGIAESRKALNGIVIGLLLMGAPGAILSVLNPATTNIDFLSGLSGITSGGVGGSDLGGSLDNASDALGDAGDAIGDDDNGGNGDNSNNSGGNGSNNSGDNSGGGGSQQPADKNQAPSTSNYSVFAIANSQVSSTECRLLTVVSSGGTFKGEACPSDQLSFATFNSDSGLFVINENASQNIHSLAGFDLA